MVRYGEIFRLKEGIIAGYSTEAEDALQKSEERFSLAMEASRDGIWDWNLTTGDIYCSPGLTSMLGYDSTDIIENVNEWQELIYQEDRQKAYQANMDCVNNLTDSFEVEYRMKTKDGGLKWILGRGQAVCRDESGRALRMIGTYHDINERKIREDKLNKSEERYRLLFDKMPSGCAVFSVQDDGETFIFRDFNKTSEKIEKINKEDLLGKSVDEVFSGVKNFGIFRVFQDVWKTGETKYFPPTCYKNDYDDDSELGTWRESWIYKLSNGNIVSLYNDVTKYKQAEEALKASEKRVRRLFETISDAIYVHDTYGRILDANPVAYQRLGYTRDEILCMSAADLDIDHPTENQVKQTITPALREGPLCVESRHQAKDGRIINVELQINVFQSDAEMLFVTIARDITQRKKTEETLRESEEKFSKLFHSSPVVMSVTTFDDGVFLDVNESFLRMLGLQKAAIIGKRADEIGMWQRANRQPILDELDRFGFAHNKEVELVLPSGRMVPLLWFGDTVKIHGKRCIVASGFDLTERKAAEEDKHRLQKQLHQSKKMEAIGTLAGGFAHEFNNMLSIISGNTEIALEDLDIYHPIVPNLNEIRKAATRSTDLIRQVLAFARKQTIAPKVVNLNHLIEGMLKIFEKLIGENIDLEWHAKMDLWPVKVDPSQIDQILVNLSVNARDSIMGTGKLTIETDNVHFDEEYCLNHKEFIPGDFVLIAVSDDGCGMEKEVLDNLFDPFFTTKDVGQGTGLGMATVYGIVKQNNGFINVYSELDQGTTIKVYLPRHMEPISRTAERELLEAVAKGDETILVVEDEEPILRMTKIMLERLGYSVLAASCPAEAIQTAESHPEEVHMLMTDVVMPDMSGKDLAEKLIRLHPDMKCLFMSGYTANVVAHHGILDEGIHFINKPFSKHDLSVKVRKVLDESKGKGHA